MFLTILDLILVLALFLFISLGFSMGLIQAVGAIVGVVLGAIVANQFFTGFGNLLTPIFLGHAGLAMTVAFILIFTLVNRLVGIIFFIIGKVFNLIAIIPFLKTFNRLLGAIFGALEGILVMGMIMIFIANLNASPWLTSIIDASQVAHWFIFIAGILTPLIPQVLNQVTQIKEQL